MRRGFRVQRSGDKGRRSFKGSGLRTQHSALGTFTSVLTPFALALLPLLTAGCGPDRSYFPLQAGNQWTYSVHPQMGAYTQTVKVAKRVAVGGVDGWELTGAMGSARLAWRGDTLIAEQMTNTRFDPPIPILVAATSHLSKTWAGTVTFSGRGSTATAVLDQRTAIETIGAQRTTVVVTVLQIDLPQRQLEIETTYAPGRGAIRQTQSSNGERDIDLMQLQGPGI